MESSSHSYLLYHVVFSTKNRKPTVKNEIKQRLYNYMAGIVKSIGGLPVLINGMSDHVHILAFLPKHVSISECMHKIKGGSSHWYNKEFGNELHKLYWQEGYNIYSVSGSQLETIKNYIFRQEEHHRTTDFNEEMESFEAKLKQYYDPAKWEHDNVIDKDE